MNLLDSANNANMTRKFNVIINKLMCSLKKKKNNI